jgi:protein disulfide-isomerase A6
LANVAAVNCDDEENKAFCGTMGIKGFPTLKTVRQTGSYGKPIMMDYNGGRSAAELVEAVKNLIPNTVEKVDDSGIDQFLQESNETAKAILFTDKGATAALTKVLANEYVTHLKFAQIRKKEKLANEMFGIEKYPTLVVLPGGDKDPVFYDGEMKKDPMNDFLDNYSERYDAKAEAKAAKEGKKAPKKDKKASKSASSEFADASASHASEDATASTITLDMPEFTESPDPDVNASPPVAVPSAAPPISTLASEAEVTKACLGPKTLTCVLAFLPPKSADEDSQFSEATQTALQSLADLAQKHKQRGGHLFPFYAIPAENSISASLKSALELRDGDIQIISVNGKRGWWMKYAVEKGFDPMAVESWIDGIRFGEGTKEKLPETLIVDEVADGKGNDKTEKPRIHEDL